MTEQNKKLNEENFSWEVRRTPLWQDFMATHEKRLMLKTSFTKAASVVIPAYLALSGSAPPAGMLAVGAGLYTLCASVQARLRTQAEDRRNATKPPPGQSALFLQASRNTIRQMVPFGMF